MKYVIAGGSIAAYTAYKEIKKYEKNADIKVISKEKLHPYSKMVLPYVLYDNSIRDSMFTGKVNEEDFVLGDSLVDVKDGVVKTQKGKEFDYDKLLIATGADAYMPDIEGIENSRVVGVRYLEDIEKMRRLISTSNLRNVVIIGAGLVGIEMGYAFSKMGLSVDFVVGSDRILSQILDEYAASLVEQQIVASHPVRFLKGERVLSIEENENRIYVKLESNKTLEGCLVVVGRGVVPNIEMFKNSNIKINSSIVVDKYLKTSIDNIYAAGDVAECDDVVSLDKRIHAVWPSAVSQAKTAAKNMLGFNIEYMPEFMRNLVPVFGIDIFTGGISKEDKFDVYTVKSDYGYRKIILEDGILKGFIVIGDVSNYGAFTYLAKERIDVSKIKDELLYGSVSMNYLP